MTAPATLSHDDATYRYRWLILAGLITAAMMEVLDTTIVNVALPQMAGNLGATFQEISWVSTGYILSNVVVLPMTAFLTSTFGRRNYLVASIALFVVSSFLCGTSGTLAELVLWRVMQGAGGAALLSTAQATIRQIFRREEQGLVQAIFLLGIIVAPTLGPTLGGFITDRYTWNWCFFINVPIGIVSAFLVATLLHDPPGMRRRIPIDWIGITLLFVGLASLQYVLEEGRRRDWFSDPDIVKLAIVSGVALAVMFWWELSPRNEHPVVDFRVLKNTQLAGSLALFLALGFGLYGGIFIFPLFTQTLLSFSPTQTGLTLMPGGIATACTAIFCGRMLNGPRPWIDPRALIYFGIALFLVAMWTLGHLTTGAGEADARWALVIRGAALGFLFTPINQIAYGSIDPRIAQQVAGLINLARQLGGSFGIAVLATFVDTRIAVHRSALVANVTSANTAFIARHQAAVAMLMNHGYNAIDADKAAMKLIEGAVMRQAAMLSYNDAWMVILWSFVIVAPAVLMLRRPTWRGPGGGH